MSQEVLLEALEFQFKMMQKVKCMSKTLQLHKLQMKNKLLTCYLKVKPKKQLLQLILINKAAEHIRFTLFTFKARLEWPVQKK